MIDVETNRSTAKWTRREQVGRVLWALTRPLFRWSPRPLWGWRRFLLRLFGARIGKGAQIYPTARITIPWNLVIGNDAAVGDGARLYALGPIAIGSRSTISQGAHLCAGTHDLDDPARTLLKLPIVVGDDAWVCADAFVGPGISIGDRSVAGARAVVVKDVPAGAVVAGNPAKLIRNL